MSFRTFACAVLTLTLCFRAAGVLAADTASSSMGTSSGSFANMVDGDVNTTWRSNTVPSTSDWIRVDKGAVVPLGNIHIYFTDPAHPSDNIKEGVLEISSDGSSWTAIASFVTPWVWDWNYTPPSGTCARYVRARPTANQSNRVAVKEFQVSIAGGGCDATAPAAPIDLTASAVSASQINLDWSDNVESDLASYSVYRSTSSGFTPSVSNRIASGVTTSSYSNTGLAPSTTYYYKVTALDTSGNESAPSGQASATTSAGDTTAPAAPVNLTASAIGCSRIDLDWSDNAESDVASYSVYRSTSSGFTPSASNRIATGVTTSSYSNTGLAASTMYYYKVTALDTSGNESAASVQASAMTTGGCDTTAPAAPTGLTATAVSSSQINLDWTDNSETDLASYSVYRSTTSGFTPSASNRVASGVTSSAYSNTGLAASTTYYYKVTAVDTSGNESTASAQASATTAAGGGGTPTPPAQPTSGPAGSDYPHGDWIVSSGGSGNNAWHVFQPTNPRPASAPVAVMIHGYGEWSGYNVMHNMIRHTVRKGYIVVYPRWQTGIFNPGTSMSQTLPTAVSGIKGGLDWLKADTTNRVQPQLDKVGYMGHSYGGMIAANIANRHVSLGLPVPKALYLFEPFGGGAGDQFDADMNGVPSVTKVSCHISVKFTETNRGCFSLFPKFGHIANANKDFVVSYSDTRGSPTLVADHFSICSPPAGAACYAADPTDPTRNAEQEKRTDAQDFFAHWKRWVAIQSCANSGTLCEYGLNDTPENRHMGIWSDGVPVREQRITDSAQAP